MSGLRPVVGHSMFRNIERRALLNMASRFAKAWEPSARLFARGLVQVTLTAANVSMIARHQTEGAFLVGTLISVFWWGNARDSSRSAVRGAAWVYGLGAGCGTVLGMELVRWWP